VKVKRLVALALVMAGPMLQAIGSLGASAPAAGIDRVGAEMGRVPAILGINRFGAD